MLSFMSLYTPYSIHHYMYINTNIWTCNIANLLSGKGFGILVMQQHVGHPSTPHTRTSHLCCVMIIFSCSPVASITAKMGSNVSHASLSDSIVRCGYRVFVWWVRELTALQLQNTCAWTKLKTRSHHFNSVYTPNTHNQPSQPHDTSRRLQPINQ